MLIIKIGQKDDNRVFNLEWCTAKENTQHAIKSGLIKPKKQGIDSTSSVKINQYDLQGKFIKEWDCMKDVQRELNIYYTNISACCMKKRKTAGGYAWEYATKA